MIFKRLIPCIILSTIDGVFSSKEALWEITFYVHSTECLKGVAIDDDKLCDAARELRAGQFEANLGGHLYKKRIPLTRGKSCGVRAVMAFKSDNDLFFINGWVKNVVKKGCREIPDDVLLLYKAVAIQMINMTPEQAQLALKTGKMREVKCDG